jgi:hypothetical protein
MQDTRRRFPAQPSFLQSEAFDMFMRFERIDEEREAKFTEAFSVATCARELGDMEVAIVALRVVDAYLHQRQPRLIDLAVINTYFR